MALADREGLDAVSMRRVGAELGVEAMSLYRHVANKEELMAGLRGLMLTEVRHHDGPSGDWKERLRVVMRSYRAACLAHPAIATISTSSRASEVSFIHFEQDLATMEEAGFSPQEAAYALRSLLAFTVGMISAEIASRNAIQSGEGATLDKEAAEKFPHLVKSYEYFMVTDRTAAFEFGLERLLTGIEQERYLDSFGGK